jgi:hypothetical protein
LNARTIKQMVLHAQPGVFLLLTVPDGPPRYLGRDDKDIREKLVKWLGRSYRYFKFLYCETPQEAFQKQCELYHSHKRTLDNTRHPERSEGTEWRCSLCDFYE